MRAAIEGDTKAFDVIVRGYSQRIFRIALAMLGNSEDAADVQQETFITAFKNLGRFRGESSIGTWIYKIASRLCLDRRRRGARRREESLDSIVLPISDTRDTPEAAVLTAESARQVRSALSKMAPNDRLVVVLKYLEQLSHSEIASILGCSEEGSRSRLARAKRIFRDLYDGVG